MRDQTSRILAEAAYLAGAESGGTALSDVLALTSLVTHHDASAVMIWDPELGHHREVSATGYPATTVAGLGDRYAESPEHKQMLQSHSPLRIDDLPYDYRSTDIFHEVLEPTGFRDGMTVCLFRDDSLYSGMLHLSAGSPQSFDDDAVQFISAIMPVITRLSIRDITAELSGDPRDPRASMVDADGVVEAADQFDPAFSTSHREFVELARRFLATPDITGHGLWPSADGWFSIHLRRVSRPLHPGGPAVRVEEHNASPLPFGLTTREADVLQGLARGQSNQQIAFERGISVRTVSTHVERILAKTGQASRAGVVAVAAQRGLLVLNY